VPLFESVFVEIGGVAHPFASCAWTGKTAKSKWRLALADGKSIVFEST
jgi:hypothetical protein